MENRKTKILIISLVFYSMSVFAQDVFTFRGLPWETNAETFIEKEGEPIKQFTAEEGKMLGDLVFRYENINVAGYKTKMEVEFKDAQLMVGIYKFTFPQPPLSLGRKNPKNYVNAYIDLQEKLISLYGEAKFKNDLEKIDGAISGLYADSIINNTPYVTAWLYKGGVIRLELAYEESLSLTLFYLSPSLTEEMLKDQKEEENSTEGL